MGNMDSTEFREKYAGKQLFAYAEDEFKLPYPTILLTWDNTYKKLNSGTRYVPQKQAVLVTTVNEKFYNMFVFLHVSREMNPYLKWVYFPACFNLFFSKQINTYVIATSYHPTLYHQKHKILQKILHECASEITMVNIFHELIHCKNINTRNHNPPAGTNKK
jgi:hypothetical protein